MIVDGRKLARGVLERVAGQVDELGRMPVVRILVQQPSAATESYLHIKEDKAEAVGIYLQLIRLEDEATTEDLIHKIQLPEADSVIVQLPLPAHVDTDQVLSSIPVSLDADVLSEAAYERFANNEAGALLPPVVGAIAEVLAHVGTPLVGKRAVVVGNGRLVGQPAALWLTSQGVTVSTVTKEEGDLSMLKEADIVVSGAGSAHLIQPEHLKQGVILIDAGTSESSGAIAGDADPGCAEVASVFTPVPGGVGPIAVACLMKNVVELARLRVS